MRTQRHRRGIEGHWSAHKRRRVAQDRGGDA
jgi:hypothetical protein